MSWLRPSTRGPSFSLMPKRMIICFDIDVIFSRSFAAPVVTSSKTSSSAARPPSSIASWASSSLRRTVASDGGPACRNRFAVAMRA